MSLWTEFKKEWSQCKRCSVGEERSSADRVVLAKGHLPCDILFVGEAPGRSESTIGKPFCGPAGRILDTIIEHAGLEEFRLAWTNIICCLPKTESGVASGKQIPREAVLACRPRLERFVTELAKPSAIVWVGEFAAKNGPNTAFSEIPQEKLNHPAAILRCHPSVKDYLIQENIVKLVDFVETTFHREEYGG